MPRRLWTTRLCTTRPLLAAGLLALASIAARAEAPAPVPVPASAASAAAPARVLDLAGAHAAALAQDATLRAARAAAAAGREALPQARARLLPELSATAARSRNQYIDRGPAGTRDTYTAGQAGLSLRQPLIRPAEWAGLRQAAARVDESEATLQRQVQELAVRVAEAYFELLLADEQIALVQAQQDAYATQLDAARKAFAAGSGTRTDIDEVQARLDLNTAQALQARQHRALALRTLQLMVGEPFDAIAPLNVAALALAAPAPREIEDWLARAERHSPELHAAQAQLDAAREEVGRTRAGHLPRLDAVADWSRSDSDNVNRIGSRYTTRSVGLQLAVPLFAGGGVASATRQAVAEEERARELLQALRHDLALRVSREFAGISEGVLRVRALEQAVRSAEQMVRSNRRSFQAGSRTTMDVLDAEQQQAAAQRDLAQARLLVLASRVKLQVLTGTFDAAGLAEVNAAFAAAPAGRDPAPPSVPSPVPSSAATPAAPVRTPAAS